MPVVPVKIIVDHSVRGLCAKPYEGHRRGCPNFEKCDRCPPRAPLIEDALDLNRDVFAVYNVFPLGAHVARMRLKHPAWTDRQLSNCLYWQGTARAQLKVEIARFHAAGLLPVPGIILTTPEACGVDITATMRNAGVILEWPPRVLAHQVAIVGTARVSGYIPDLDCPDDVDCEAYDD